MSKTTLKGKTVFITGSSRGIGRSIALRCAREGANLVIAAKTVESHAKLPGTIHTVAKEVEAAGGKALAIPLDVRFEDQIQKAVETILENFGAIDILVNNASALYPAPTLQMPPKKLDLLLSCNLRATFICSQCCLPHLMKSENPHILNLSPPLNMEAKWFKDHLGYTISKYGMSLCTLGMAEEFREAGVAVNSLWPKTIIATSAIATFFPEMMKRCRTPEIVAEAAYHILTQDSRKTTGRFFIDEEALKEAGQTDFSVYAVEPEAELQTDFFVE